MKWDENGCGVSGGRVHVITHRSRDKYDIILEGLRKDKKEDGILNGISESGLSRPRRTVMYTFDR
jgi:hypothetical protein